ncbi:kinase-like domain-containing protein [Lentinula raphanica]|uniref:Kinase-like domain-containing protein n=1 Tax=Lentinula raphanica TaxID=153919 RepID=A0AA38P419_9AGAR|nr:kinase-like domain-containing protein [Lentinula raphanica]KAJ3835925.1 kinase-like domain-containing protein [Lentinula raphanica]
MPLPNTRSDFDIDARPHVFRSPTEWAAFWHGLAPWFHARGYTLHDPGSKTGFGLSDRYTVPVNNTNHPQQHPPFAYTNVSAQPDYMYDSDPRERKPNIPDRTNRAPAPSLVPIRVPPFIATSNTGRVYAAQDSLSRHVYIKILRRGSEQLRVVELLRQQKETPGVLSILDVLEYDDEYAFIVMPRWADIPGPNYFLRSLGDVGEFVVDILKGLDTLHSLRIAHRDMKINNMVMNHLFPLPVRALRPLQHLNIQSSCGISQLITDSREVIHHRLEFAIIDFDFAMIIPRREDGKDLLPSSLAWMQEYSALDVAQGELVYDPFKYDVGVLGVMFCEMLQRYTPVVPYLAPLLDRMTTHELSNRFTARQAHAFAQKYLLDGLSEKQLQQSLTLSLNQPSTSTPGNNSPHQNRTYSLTSPWTSYDRWANLPPSFFTEFPQWSEYVTPPLPRWKRWLRRGCETEEGRRRIKRIRKVLAVVGIGESVV